MLICNRCFGALESSPRAAQPSHSRLLYPWKFLHMHFACAFIELTRTHFSTIQNILPASSGWTLWGCSPTVGRAGRQPCTCSCLRQPFMMGRQLMWLKQTGRRTPGGEACKKKKEKKVERIVHWIVFKAQWLLFNSEFEIKCRCFWSSIEGNIWTRCPSSPFQEENVEKKMRTQQFKRCFNSHRNKAGMF